MKRTSMDDFPNNASTTGFYFVRDQPIKGINEDFDDVDWIRVGGLKRWHFYNVWYYAEEIRPSFRSLRLVDGAGDVIDFLTPRFPARGEYQHVHPGSEPLFMEASLTGGDYKIFIREEDDAANSFREAANFELGERAFHAGAIQPDDIDYVKFKLREGIEYTIDLHGADSNAAFETTLSNPLLRIFGPNGTVVAADNNSGTGKNAQIVFTPEETNEYVFQIVGFQSTGSYVLSSDQFDDFSTDVNTSGILRTDGSVSRGRNDFEFDEDWFRTTPLLEHYTYQFRINRLEDGFAQMFLRDGSGNSARFSDGRPGVPGELLSVEPGEAGRRFIGVRSNGDYELTAQPFDFIGSASNDFFDMNFLVNEAIGVIEEPGDRDWFRKQLLSYGKYRIEAVPLQGQPADAFEITPRSFDTETVFDTIESGGVFRPLERIMFFDVGESVDGNGSGAYELKFFPLDAASDNENTSWNVQMTNGKGRIRNANETFDDVDWHRIQLEDNTWYEFNVLSGNSEVDILRPDGTTVSLDRFNEQYYFSDQQGEHYIIVESQFASSIDIAITSDTKRTVDSQALYFKNFERPSIGSLISFESEEELMQIYSDLPLHYNTADGAVDLAANTLHTVTRRVANELKLKQRQFVGTAEIFARAAMNENSWTAWAVGEIYGMGPSFSLTSEPGSFSSSSAHRYAFAESPPDYLSLPEYSNLTDFAVLTEDQRAAVNNAMEQWNFSSFENARGFQLADNPENADFLIYNISFGDDTIHAYGGFRTSEVGRDLLLNSSSSVFSADTSMSSDRSTFELIRGLGQSLGLSTPEGLSRLRTVMGNRDPGIASDVSIPWPTTPLPEDIAVFRQRNAIHRNDPEKNVYWLGSGTNTPFFRTISDSIFGEGNNNIVSAFGSSLPATIDLRGGRTSFVQSESDRPYNYANSIQSYIFDGYGGDNDDVLIGNFIGNRLVGGKGNDYLIGGGGSDSLFGGEGDDRYGFKPGYEKALINEQLKGGTDILEIEGMFNLDSLHDDLTFQRLGNNLNIRLDWDSELDSNTDEIRIFNMADPMSKVETLTLTNPDGQIARIDLNSAFEQSDSTRRRFQVIAGTSEFGNLVAPI
jgi:hypothetical protein